MKENDAIEIEIVNVKENDAVPVHRQAVNNHRHRVNHHEKKRNVANREAVQEAVKNGTRSKNRQDVKNVIRIEIRTEKKSDDIVIVADQKNHPVK